MFPALGRQRQIDLRVRGQPGLQIEFHDNQEKLSLENQKQNKNRKK